MSLVLLLYRASRPHVAELGHVPGTRGQYSDIDRHPDNTQYPGIVIVRPEGGLFFANADGTERLIRARARAEHARAVVLDAETIPYVDISAVKTLTNLSRDLAAGGVRLVIAHDIGQVRDLFEAAHAEQLIGDVYPTVQAAIDDLTKRE